MTKGRFIIRPMPELRDRVRDARLARGWSQRELAKRAGVTGQSIQQIEAGSVRRPQNIVEIAEALGTTPDFLLQGIGAGGETVPVVGIARAGSEQVDYREGQGELGTVEAPAMSTDRTVALEVQGDSMGGRIEDGDLVFYDDRREPVTSDLFGRLCVVGCSDGRVLVKRIKGGSRPGFFHLLSYNADPEFDVKVDWAARVTSIRPK